MHERHVELVIERERRERLRLGHAVAMLMMAQGAKRRDGQALSGSDVFPDPVEEEDDERAEREKQMRIYNMFRTMAKVNRA